MSLYKITNHKLNQIKELRFNLEKDLQSIVENNLAEIFGLQFVTSEFALDSLRIDTLAFDVESKSFVIIEYKKGQNLTVIDQGFAYLALMVNNKAEFILEYNEKFNQNLKREDVDWSQSRILFVSPSFTAHQENAINFRDLPIELWQVTRFEQDMILFNQIKAQNPRDSITTVTKDENIQKVSKEIEVVEIEDHFRGDRIELKKLYDLLQEKVLELYPNLTPKSKKAYIGFQNSSGYNIFSVHTKTKHLILVLNRHKPEDLNDPERKVTYWENSFQNYNQHMSKFLIETEQDILYAIMLIKQVYEDYYKKQS